MELPQYEIEFEENLSKLRKTINTLRDKDVEYALKVLKILNRNFNFDHNFMLTIFELPFFALKNLSFDERQKFLNDVVELLKTTVENNKTKSPKKD